MSSRRLIGLSLALTLMALPLLLHGCTAEQLARAGLLRGTLPTASVIECPELDDLAEGDPIPAGCEALLEEEQRQRAQAEATPSASPAVTPTPSGGLSGRVEFGTTPLPSVTTPPPFPKIETPTPEPFPSAIQGSLGE